VRNRPASSSRTDALAERYRVVRTTTSALAARRFAACWTQHYVATGRVRPQAA
jgi:hypothetical protein